MCRLNVARMVLMPSVLCELAKRSDQELKDEEMELFTKYYLEWKGGRKNASTSCMNIPRFYYRVSAVLIISTTITVLKNKSLPLVQKSSLVHSIL